MNERPPHLDEDAVISLRLASKSDDAALEQLATLSGRAKAPGPWILAEVDSQLWAALPLAGGEPLADPFRQTAELGALLSLRAKQLGRDERERRDSARRFRRRLRTSTALVFTTPKVRF
jgi:hypothetical protein